MNHNLRDSEHNAKVVNKEIHYINEPVLRNTGSFNNLENKSTKSHRKLHNNLLMRLLYISLSAIFVLVSAYFIINNYFYKTYNFSNSIISITIPNHTDYIFSDKSTSEYDNFVWSKKNNQSRASITVRIERTQKNKSEETEYLDGIISESYFLQNYSKTYFSIKNFVIIDSQRNNMNLRDVQFDVYQNIELKAKFRDIYNWRQQNCNASDISRTL
jgi:hypothetical protein